MLSAARARLAGGHGRAALPPEHPSLGATGSGWEGPPGPGTAEGRDGPGGVRRLLAGSPPSPLRLPCGPPGPSATPRPPSLCSRHCWGLAGCRAGAQRVLSFLGVCPTDRPDGPPAVLVAWVGTCLTSRWPGVGREKKPHFNKDSVWPAHVSEGEVKCISTGSLPPAPRNPSLRVGAGRVCHSGVVAPVALSKLKKKIPPLLRFLQNHILYLHPPPHLF